MKKVRLTFSMIVLALIVCINSQAQMVHQQVVVTLTGLDYGPGIGVVTGTYTYQYSFRLDEDGLLESIHWNVIDCNLTNEKGYKVKVIDSGHDTYGIFWFLWNNINLFNYGYPISYAVEDGWLNDMMPATLPAEGTIVAMSTHILCRGTVIDRSTMLVFHINAHGTVTANVVKGWLNDIL